MAQCTYSYNGKDGMSYKDLSDEVAKNATNTDFANLFDNGKSRQDYLYDNLMILHEKNRSINLNKKVHEDGILDEDPDLAHDDNTFTPKSFIDSGFFLIDGQAPVFRLSTEDYINTMKKMFVNDNLMSSEEADAWGEMVQARWDNIADNAAKFHQLIMLDTRVDDATWRARTKGTVFSGITGMVSDAEKRIARNVMLLNGKDRSGVGSAGKVIKNLNLEADLRGMPQTMRGHIDYLVVRDTGEIEVFMVKTSTEPYSQWAWAKKEKYNYEAALLKQMLAFNGIGAADIRMNIIPVHLKYNNDFTGIESINVQDTVSIDTHNMQYIFNKYDNVAAQFLESKIDASNVKMDSLSKVTTQMQYIFPGRDIRGSGIRKTAQEYVRRNWKYCRPKALPGGGYMLTIPETNEVITVKDSRKGARNDEFVKWVEDNLKDDYDAFTGNKSAHRLISDLRNSFRLGFFSTNSHEGPLHSYLSERFAPYLEHETETVGGKEVFTYKWRMLESDVLDAANIVAFQNLDTNQVDVFSVTAMDPSVRCPFKNNRKNLMGAYLPDLNMENFVMEANYGNVEAIRATTVLNEVLPQMEGTFKLGKLTVIGMSDYHSKTAASFEFSELLRDWGKVIKIVNANNSEAKIQNNFQRTASVSCVSYLEVLMQTWNDIQTAYPDIDFSELSDATSIFQRKMLEDGTYTDAIVDLSSDEQKMHKLEEFIDRLRVLAEGKIDLANPRKLLRAQRSADKNIAALAQLYTAAMKAYSLYCGDFPNVNEDFSKMEEYIMKPTSIGNTSARRVGFLTQQFIDNIRSRMLNNYMPKVMPIFREFYKDAGYSEVRRMTVGDQTAVYRHLYELDESGQNTLMLKNPYDDSNDLRSYERKFLKNIMFEFYKIKCAMFGRACDITGVDDPKLRSAMPSGYLNLPLQRASIATRRQDWSGTIERLGASIHELLHHPKEYMEEKVSEATGQLLSDDDGVRDHSLSCLQAYNPYKRSEGDQREREIYIDARGSNYFETNMENVFVDFMFKQVQCEEFNKLLVRINGIELALVMKGIEEGDEKAVDHTIKQIDEFVSLNVYGKPIMEKTARIIDRVLMPIRRFVSTFYIANNPVAAVRDIIQGLEANFVRVLTKYQTNLNASDVAYGYQWVTKDSLKDIASMSMFNQFNIKFGFSNFDAARVSERLKTGRGGILNPEHWLYWSLRAPDYLNRMVLFAAQLHHDGVTEAYSLDENKRLVYDWKKDKRFSAYAAKNTSDPKYKEQESLYMSMIREFNKDNPSLNLAYTDDLPDAYTPTQIRAFKTLGESIYGAYDQSSKNKAENVAVGRNFLFFFTWMNGMVDNYFKKTQISQSELRTEQETDYEGNPLFFAADGSGNTTTTDTGIPVVKDVPIMVQGVFSTIADAVRELHGNGWNFDAYKKDLLTNPIVLRNYKRMTADLLVSALFALLFGIWLTPAYKKHKTEGDGQMLATNIMTELTYKGLSRSYDVFHGPAAVLQYFGESTSPATYRVSSKLAKDAWKFLSGDRNFSETLWNSQAFFRSMQDSYKMWKRDNTTATA